ncbi:hypothetical protein F5Y05DRAFT_153385 [Hypoxylon sp. FL0543]|nr:hypothetical protein F5Y05DRAFT_153385 [Hypoxylon sp. FL0543]
MVSSMVRAENAGEGPSRSSARTMTLGDAMRGPSVNAPGVVLLDTLHHVGQREEVIDPKEDLWLTSADGRYNSPIIPLRVGTAPERQTFYVHKHVLIKAEFFKKALCGEFRESEAQAIELPEEDPAIFHFVVAFLYENKYVPIQAAATVLISDDKVNARRTEDERTGSDSDSSASILSDSSTARSQRRRERRRRRENRHWERERRKHPGMHRPGCACRQCLTRGGPPCWNCMAPRLPPPPPGPMPFHVPGGVVIVDTNPPRQRPRRRRPNHHRPQSPAPPAPGTSNSNNTNTNDDIRIQGQDLRTWLLTYELNLDVYICANKFLLDDFKAAIARVCIDMLETAGADAAQVEVLRLCYKLYEGLPESDPLLRMIFARVGFLNTHLWRRYPDETAEFFHAHPEVSALMFKETLVRREEEHGELPASK